MEWLKRQGLTGKNLLEILFQDCVRQGIDVVGITAEEGRELGWIDKRFEFLLNTYGPNLKRGKGYQIQEIEEGMFSVTKRDQKGEDNSVYVVRAQVAQALDPNGGKKNPSKVLIFGGRKYIPNSMPLEDTLQSARDTMGLVIGENPVEEGLKSERAEQFLRSIEYIDAVIGFDAQKGARKNKTARDFAIEAQRNWVAIGNQHSPSSCGAGIAVEDKEVLHSAEALNAYLTGLIREGSYQNDCKPEKLSTRVSWMWRFALGIRGNKHLHYT